MKPLETYVCGCLFKKKKNVDQGGTNHERKANDHPYRFTVDGPHSWMLRIWICYWNAIPVRGFSGPLVVVGCVGHKVANK